jgi:hypothetical protein
MEPNDTEEGRAHNRRVDLVILNQQAIVTEPRTGGGVSIVGPGSTKGSAGNSH